MTQLFRAWVSPLIVGTGLAVSRAVDMANEGFDAEAFSVQAPADIDSKTYTWEVSNSNVALTGAIVWATLIDTAGANIIVPGVSKALCLNGILTGWRYFRLKASAAVSTDITFLISKSTRA